MYRYEVTESVKDAIEGVIGRPVFYEDNETFYIDDPNQRKVFQYYDGNGDLISKDLDAICQDIYTTDFDAQSIKLEYKQVQEVQLQNLDPDTGAPAFSTRKVPAGWFPMLREMEFETGKIGSVHDKSPPRPGIPSADLGAYTLQFFRADMTEITSGVQADIDAECAVTIVMFDPAEDWGIRAASIRQITVPAGDLFAWTDVCVFVAPSVLFPLPYSQGGLNLFFQDTRQDVGVGDENYSFFKPGEKLQWTFEHGVGVKHKVRILTELAKKLA